MQYFKSLAKELAESLLRFYKKSKVDKQIKKKYIKEYECLSSEGFYVVDDFLARSECESLIKEFDAIIDGGKANIWKDEQGADSRIYYIDSISEKFKKIYDTPYFRDVLKIYTGNTDQKGMLLAGRIDDVEGNIGSGGGWHRDSPFTHQLKAIIYLSDVNEYNGPFQYVTGSHRKSAVIKSYLRKIFYPGQYRFTEKEISKYCDTNNSSIISFAAKAGTLLFADTKGIHRGKPIEKGYRYAVFCYYWDGKVPDQFNKYKQCS